MASTTFSTKVPVELLNRLDAFVKTRGDCRNAFVVRLLERALELGVTDLAEARQRAQQTSDEAVRDRILAVEKVLGALTERREELKAEEARLAQEADAIRAGGLGGGDGIRGTAARLREAEDSLGFVRGLLADLDRRIREAEAEKADLQRQAMATYVENFEQAASLILQREADLVVERLVSFQEQLLEVLSELYVLSPGDKRRILRQLDHYLTYRAAGEARDQDVIGYHVSRDTGTAHLLREWPSAWSVFTEGGRRRDGGSAGGRP